MADSPVTGADNDYTEQPRTGTACGAVTAQSPAASLPSSAKFCEASRRERFFVRFSGLFDCVCEWRDVWQVLKSGATEIPTAMRPVVQNRVSIGGVSCVEATDGKQLSYRLESEPTDTDADGHVQGRW